MVLVEKEMPEKFGYCTVEIEQEWILLFCTGIIFYESVYHFLDSRKDSEKKE